MRETTFYTDPQVLFLSQVLEELHKGKTEIPRFQRPLVWDWETRVELLRSVRDGIPMGSIMVWRTSIKTMESFDWIGPFKLAKPVEQGPRQYLLDGVQRLTTLYGALYESAGSQMAEQDEYSVFYDLQLEEFVTRKDLETRVGPIETILPLSILLDSVALIRFQRKLPDQSDDLVARVDEIASAFRNYKVPIIPITTDDLELATRTFQRINSQGAEMNEAHMLQALTWREDFDLREKLDQLREDYLVPLGWSDLDDDEILKTCKIAAGMDVYEADIDDLSIALRSNPDSLTQAIRSIAQAIGFLKTKCHVPSLAFLPYSLQLTLLSEAFRIRPSPSVELIDALHDWFFISTYGELFRGMSGYRLQRTISDLRQGVPVNKITWSGHKKYERLPIRSNFDLRAARAKAMILLLARQHDRYLTPRASDFLADLGKAGVVQLVTASRANLRTSMVSGPANRVLCKPEQISGFRSELLNPTVSDDILLAHVISDEAQDAWRDNDLQRFLNLRSTDLEILEEEFIAPIEKRYFSS